MICLWAIFEPALSLSKGLWHADKLEGGSFDRLRTSCDVLKLRPGITGPATQKSRLEDEQIAAFVAKVRNLNDNDNDDDNLSLPENVKEMTDQELAVWYNDNVIYPDKVRINRYFLQHYSFIMDIRMIFATVLGWKVKFAGEEF